MVGQYQRSHCFHNWYCAGYHTGVVAAFAFYGGRFTGCIDRYLVAHNGGDGLKCDAEINIHSIADAALYAA